MGELRAGTATSGLSRRLRSQRPSSRLCEPEGMGREGGTGAGAPRSPEAGSLPTRCSPSRRPGRSLPNSAGGSSRFRRLGQVPGHATAAGSAHPLAAA